MIGVIPKESEIKIVEEFFQLFKTPWEMCVPNHDYDVVIATANEIPLNLKAKLLVIYNSECTKFDCERRIVTRARQKNVRLGCNGIEFPVYGDTLAFQPAGQAFIRRAGKSEVVGFARGESVHQSVRIGYDLFQEVSFLLSQGQPSHNAFIPTLEIHISLLRNLMVNAGIPFVEVPPIPAGHDFMACLTHDVDFMGIRQHKLDHTMWGFLYRALLGSVISVLRGRMGWSKLLQNWKAALSLPFIYLGLQADIWSEFDQYSEIERDLGSTFFFIPYKNRPGEPVSGRVEKRRGAKYEITEIKEQVQELIKQGCEIGLHGIDAWHDSHKGSKESHRIHDVTGQSEVGVRMHWLYFSENSPKALEAAGFSYDSTFGYNDAIGFRAGTAQAFRPPTAETLLELPLNIQDTAMFYSDRMNLSEDVALDTCKQLIQHILLFGGALTVNWHARSLSPERLWGDSYRRLLKQIGDHCVWFGTANEIAKWFRKRRALCFDRVQFAEDRLLLKLAGPVPDGQPPFVVRVYHPKFTSAVGATLPALMPNYVDYPWKGETELEVTL